MKPPTPDLDAGGDLLVRHREGDPLAFKILVERYQARMVQFFYRMCWDRDRAEDLAQELFLKLMQACRRYQPTGRLSTYVYRVATNLWIDHYRTLRPQPRLYSLDQVLVADREPATAAPSPGAQLAEDEERRKLRRALESLTEPHRLVFELAVYQERPYAEIAQLLDIPIGTVKSRMHNCVTALKQLLGEADAARDRDERRGREARP